MQKRALAVLLTFLPNFVFSKEKPMTSQMEHLSVTISRPAGEVYEYASNPLNLPQWAAGLSKSKIEKNGEDWVSDSPMGKVRIKFATQNSFGILDHVVTVPSGETTHNAFRVIPNNEGSELIFSLSRPAKMTDTDFKKDAEQVRKDLVQLKNILEKK